MVDNKLSNILNKFQEKHRDQITDFCNFWYNKNRFKYRPVVGYVHGSYKSKNFNINKQGFRSKNDYKEKLILDKKKIFFLGPSSLVGIPCLSDIETLPNMVEEKLNEKQNTYSTFNFGLISSKINTQFSLLHQILLESTPEYVILTCGYNDMMSGHHGQKFEYYNDIDKIFRNSFEFQKQSDNIIYNLDNFITSISNKIFDKFFNLKKIGKSNLLVNDLVLKRRKILKKIIKKENTYKFCQKNLLNHLKMCFFLIQSLKIKCIFIPETSLLSTSKKLSDYESEYLKNDGNFGLYKNSNREDEMLEFNKIYNKTYNLACDLAKSMNVELIDFEEIICKLDNKETIFFDDIHLTKFATNILAENIVNLINK